GSRARLARRELEKRRRDAVARSARRSRSRPGRPRGGATLAQSAAAPAVPPRRLGPDGSGAAAHGLRPVADGDGGRELAFRRADAGGSSRTFGRDVGPRLSRANDGRGLLVLAARVRPRRRTGEAVRMGLTRSYGLAVGGGVRLTDVGPRDGLQNE